jgi:predicted HTH transcriptional regulator
MSREDAIRALLEASIEMGHEFDAVEVKAAGESTDTHHLAVVAKAVLGMTNRRDGGIVAIGINDDLEVIGLSVEQASTWSYDEVAAKLAPFADPHIDFEVYPLEIGGRTVVVVDVQEFAEMPVICSKDSAKTEKGTIYVRPRGQAKTTNRLTSSQLRELLDLGVEKRLASVLAMLRRSGLVMPPPEDPDSAEFARERKDFP